MRELSLHVLDLIENAIEAGASRIDVTIDEDPQADRLVITVRDDGRGMDAETLGCVRDPFCTTRTTRHVGLGIPLLAAAAERCGGRLDIVSAPQSGTIVTATFQHGHIDRAPLGDICSTLVCALMRGDAFDLHYLHRVRDRAFELDTREIRDKLGDVPLSFPAVREWLSAFVAQGEEQLKENPDAQAEIA